MKRKYMLPKAASAISVLVLIYWFTTGAIFGGKGPQNGDFKLYTASFVESGKAEVRLRWVMKAGWLPEGGFNLYRNEPGGNEVLLNPAILGADPGKLANTPWKIPAAPQAREGTSKQKIQYSYQEAVKLVASNKDKMPVAVFGKAGIRVESTKSALAFQQLNQLRVQQINTPEIDPLAKVDPLAKPVPHMVAGNTAAYPDLEHYESLIGFTPAASASRKFQKVVEEPPAVMLRTNLVFGAMLHPNTIGSDLGLAFTDQTVVAGKTYHYTLKVVEKGNPAKQTTVAERDVVVQNDLPLAAPTGLKGFQFDATTVCLRWNRIEPTDSVGLVSFNLIRTDKNNPTGKQVNNLPILIRDIRLPAKVGLATHMEPMVLYHDTTAGSIAPGQVSYQLVAVDMFGRRSSPGTATVKLEDLVTPPRVEHIAAELDGKSNKVHVVWSAVGQSDVLYNISRIDVETKKVDLLGQVSGNLPILRDNTETANLVQQVNIRHSTKAKKGDLVSQIKWLSFSDTPPDDHYFLYKVNAVYKTHPRVSPPQFTKTIPVPSLKSPVAPVVVANYIEVDKLPKTLAKKADDKRQPPEDGKGSEIATFLRARDIPSAIPVNLAGAVHLKWNPVPMAQAYRIYRASGTGFRSSSSNTIGDIKNPLVQVGDKGRFHYRSEIPDSELKEGQFSLVGQVDGKNEFLDYISRSPAHVYWYRVVAVNRWGVPSASTKETSQAWSNAVKARVPGTVPPAAPILLAATPEVAGNIELSIAVPSSTDAAVNYRVYRAESAQTARARTSTFIVLRDHKQILADKGQRKGDEIVIVDKLVQSGLLYEYYVVADNGEKTPILSPASQKVRTHTFKALAIAPTNVTAASNAGEITIQWKGVANASGYIVERTQSSGTTSKFAQVSDLQLGLVFIDRTPGPGPKITYRVIAVDKSGNISDPNAYPLNQQQKDASKYPAQVTINVKGN